MIRTPLVAAAVATLFLLFPAGSAPAIYSWVDEKGQTHISDYPQPKSPAENIPVEADAYKGETKPSAAIPPVKTEQPQPLAAVPTVSALPKSVQSVTPPSVRQHQDSAPSPAVTPATSPAQSGVDVGSTVPQEPPMNKAARNVMMQNSGIVRMIKVFISTFLIFLIAGYLYFSLCLHLIARKLNVPGAWIAWVPIFQIMALLASASKPAWWILLFFVPLVNIVIPIYLWMRISENLGRDKWLGLLMLVPVANLVYLGMLAFSKQNGRGDLSVAAS